MPIIFFLDSLDADGSIPQAFCYVPNMDQVNRYKNYKKLLDSAGAGRKQLNNTPKPNGDRLGNINSALASGLRQNPQNNEPHLMTVQEFLLTSSSSGFDSGSSSRRSSQQTLESGSATPQAATGSPNSRVMSSSRFIASLENLIERYERVRGGTDNNNTTSSSLPSSKKEIVEYTDQDFDVSGRTAYNVWEHVCSDKIWENVLEYYYSTCTTTDARKTQCFQLKGIDLTQPENPKRLAKTLLFKATRNNEKLKCVSSKRKREKERTNSAQLTFATPENEELLSCYDGSDDILNEVTATVNDLINKVVHATSSLNIENPPLEQAPSRSTIPKIFAENDEKSPITNKRSATRRKDAPLFSTTIKPSEKRKPASTDSKKQLVNIDTNTEMTNQISSCPSALRWTRKHDFDLIDYMVTLRKGNESESMVLVRINNLFHIYIFNCYKVSQK